MRKVAILIVLAGVALGSYFLFFKSLAPPQPVSEPAKKQIDKPKPAPKKPSPVFEPSKFHPLKHYNGPKNRFADNYFKNENLREELHEDREELADTIQNYDKYNHYDYHDDYQYAYDNYYSDDDYYYHDYYDYMYPQFDDSEWERLNSIYSDPDVKDYLKEDRQAKSDKGSDTSMKVPDEKAKAAQAKLQDPVVKKEQKLKKEFIDNKKSTISKIAPNTTRTLDFFLAQKAADKKFDIFGTHERETFSQALPSAIQAKVLSQEILITDGSSGEINKHFYDDENKSIFPLDRTELESDVDIFEGEKVVVVIKSTSLFGDDGLLNHLIKDGYTIQRYKTDSSLEKYETTGPG